MADAGDLKSPGRKAVRVRFPPRPIEGFASSFHPAAGPPVSRGDLLLFGSLSLQKPIHPTNRMDALVGWAVVGSLESVESLRVAMPVHKSQSTTEGTFAPLKHL